jgi:hypothetical protein
MSKIAGIAGLAVLFAAYVGNWLIDLVSGVVCIAIESLSIIKSPILKFDVI